MRPNARPRHTAVDARLAVEVTSRPLRALYEYAALLASFGVLALICILWSACAFVLYYALPEAPATALGRRVITHGFRLYAGMLSAIGAYRLDLAELDTLRGGPPLILAPNHPSLIDALLILGRRPNTACVMKSTLIGNPFFGAGARLARYVRNDSPRQLVKESVGILRNGASLLLFPEGTRTERPPVNALAAGIGLIAKRAGVPVQTLLIETDSPFLGKGWPLFRAPHLPITYRVRLGERFTPGADAATLVADLDRYFRRALGR